MNIEQAKEFFKDEALKAIEVFAQQCVEAERERIRAGIEALRTDENMWFTRHEALDAALAVVDGGEQLDGTNERMRRDRRRGRNRQGCGGRTQQQN